jgi:hypothetical protein
MKPLSQSPVQAQPVLSPPTRPGDLPTWTDLPLSRQQEVIGLLAGLLLRHWPSPAHQPQEAGHERQP